MALSNDEMPPHPDLNSLAAFADHRLSDDERAALVDHLNGCSECRSTLAALARGLAAPAQPSTGFRNSTAWLSLAATLMLATAVGTVVWRADRGEQVPARPPAAAPPAETPVPQGPGAPSGPPPAIPQPAAPAPAEPPSLAERRGGVREISGKTFRLVAGEWVDAAYDPLGLLPTQRAADAGERAALLARVPALKPFAGLGPRVLVVHDGIVYRFGAPN